MGGLRDLWYYSRASGISRQIFGVDLFAAEKIAPGLPALCSKLRASRCSYKDGAILGISYVHRVAMERLGADIWRNGDGGGLMQKLARIVEVAEQWHNARQIVPNSLMMALENYYMVMRLHEEFSGVHSEAAKELRMKLDRFKDAHWLA